MKHGKKYQDSVKLIDHLNQYDPDQAAQLVVSTGKAKFDETVEVSIRLGVDPRHADQQVRGAVVLPHGTGRSIRVLVIAKGAKADEARAAGADYVGDQDMITKIQTENWFDFDVCVATPDMMGLVGRIGRVQGLFRRAEDSGEPDCPDGSHQQGEARRGEGRLCAQPVHQQHHGSVRPREPAEVLMN